MIVVLGVPSSQSGAQSKIRAGSYLTDLGPR